MSKTALTTALGLMMAAAAPAAYAQTSAPMQNRPDDAKRLYDDLR